MRDIDLFQLALGLVPPWMVVDAKFDVDKKRLDIEIDFKTGGRFACPECGKADCPVHDTVKKTWRHLNFFQHEAFLHARVARIDCPDCGVRLVNVPWARPGSGFTLLFEAFVMTLVKDMPVAAAAVARFADHVDVHNSDASRIKDVCVDMSGAYIKGVTENLTEAEITFDKFHAVKLVNDAVDQVRRAESKDRPQLKYSRYLWLMNESRLSVEQSLSLEALCSMNLKTAARLQDPARLPRYLQLSVPRLGRARARSLVQLGDPIAPRADQEGRAHRKAASRWYSAMVRFQDPQRPHRGHQQPRSGREGQSGAIAHCAIPSPSPT